MTNKKIKKSFEKKKVEKSHKNKSVKKKKSSKKKSVKKSDEKKSSKKNNIETNNIKIQELLTIKLLKQIETLENKIKSIERQTRKNKKTKYIILTNKNN